MTEVTMQSDQTSLYSKCLPEVRLKPVCSRSSWSWEATTDLAQGWKTGDWLEGLVRGCSWTSLITASLSMGGTVPSFKEAFITPLLPQSSPFWQVLSARKGRVWKHRCAQVRDDAGHGFGGASCLSFWQFQSKSYYFSFLVFAYWSFLDKIKV